MIGKVIEVFIPDGELDVMDSNLVGFKVMIDNELKEIVLEQDEFNSKIMKDDLVVVRKQNISGKDFVDIELYGDKE